MLSSTHIEVPADRSGLSFFSNVPSADRPGDVHRRFWTQWIYPFCDWGANCSEHAHCWGNTILRTSYDDDDKFSRAVAAIRRLAMAPIQYDFDMRGTGSARNQPAGDDGPEVDEDVRLDVTASYPGLVESVRESYRDMARRARANVPLGVRCTHDWVVTYELVRRYHDVVVEDKALDGADLPAASGYFKDNYKEHVHGLRGHMFVLLDGEAIEHLSGAPGEEELAAMTPLGRARAAWDHWIKVVSEACGVTNEGEEVEEEMSDDAIGRRRIRLYDYLDTYLSLQGCDLAEVSVEGKGRERFPGYELEDEWLLCDNFDAGFEQRPWLEELYGERKR